MSLGVLSRRWSRRVSGCPVRRRRRWANRGTGNARRASPTRSTPGPWQERSWREGVERFPAAFLHERALEIRLPPTTAQTSGLSARG